MLGHVGNALWHDLGANPEADAMIDAVRELDRLLGLLRTPGTDAVMYATSVQDTIRTAITEAHRGGVNEPVAWIVGRMCAGMVMFDVTEHLLAACRMWTSGPVD